MKHLTDRTRQLESNCVQAAIRLPSCCRDRQLRSNRAAWKEMNEIVYFVLRSEFDFHWQFVGDGNVHICFRCSECSRRKIRGSAAVLSKGIVPSKLFKAWPGSDVRTRMFSIQRGRERKDPANLLWLSSCWWPFQHISSYCPVNDPRRHFHPMTQLSAPLDQQWSDQLIT